MNVEMFRKAMAQVEDTAIVVVQTPFPGSPFRLASARQRYAVRDKAGRLYPWAGDKAMKPDEERIVVLVID